MLVIIYMCCGVNKRNTKPSILQPKIHLNRNQLHHTVVLSITVYLLRIFVTYYLLV